MKWSLFWVLLLVSVAWSQTTFQPQDADEAEAWRLYQEYRQCLAREAPLSSALKQKFSDSFMGAHGYMAGLGVDREAGSEAARLREQIDALHRREEELLSAWGSKFYWRYGDLRWASDNLQDPKTGRTMDRIEFALIYFRFNRDASAAATPASAATNCLAEKGGGDAWSHLQVGLGNVTNFSTQDQQGWRNNGTSFEAVAGSGTVNLRLNITAKGGVTYQDYQFSAQVRSSSGRMLLDQRGTISKDGGSQAFTAQWQPAQDPGPLEVRLTIAGGNPEGFAYFVSGRVQGPKGNTGVSSPAATPNPVATPTPNPVASNPVVRPTSPPQELFSNGNDMAVFNGGQPAIIDLSRPVSVQTMINYHWNDGRGAPAGTVALRHSSGAVFGPWQARLVNGVYWYVDGPISLPAGRYTVIDSDPNTWSQNSGSGGRGIVIWRGLPEN